MRIFRSAVLIFGMRVVGAGLLFFVYSFLSKTQGEEQVAELAVFLSVFAICGTISRGGLDQYLLREMPKHDERGRGELAANAVALAVVVGLFSALVVGYSWNSFLLGAGVLFYALYSVVPEIYRASGSALRYAVLRNFAFNFFLAFIVFIFYYFEFSKSASASLGLAAFFSLLISFLAFFGVYQADCFKFLRWKGAIGLVGAGLPIALFQLLVVAHTYGYNLALDVIGGARDTARFAVYLQVVLVFAMFSTSVGVHIGRDLAVAVSKGDYELVRRLYGQACLVSVAVTGPIFLILIYAAPFLFPYFFGFSGDFDLLSFYIMAGTAFFNSASGPKLTVLNMLRRERVVLIVGGMLTLFVLIGFLLSEYFFNKVLFVAVLYSIFSGGLALSMSIYTMGLLHRLIAVRS